MTSPPQDPPRRDAPAPVVTSPHRPGEPSRTRHAQASSPSRPRHAHASSPSHARPGRTAPPPALTALLLILAAGVCTGVALAGVLAARLVDLRDDVAAARRACTCCDEAPP